MKTFMRRAIAVATLIISSATLAAAENDYVHEMAPNIYSFGQGNAHSMFMVTDEGVAVFETFNTAHSEALLAAIREVTDQPIRYAFHTHNHWDHSGGGQVFRDEGAETVMHSFADEYLEANPGRDTARASIVWDGQKTDFSLGDMTVEAHYMGLSHGLGMTVFVIPEARVGYIGDLVTPNRVMFAIVPDFNIRGLETALEALPNLAFDRAVCSHNELPAGEVEMGCTQAHAAEGLQYIRDLRAAIMAEFQKGTPDVAAAIELPQYAHWAHYDDWLEMNAWRVMVDLFMGPFPWVPNQ